MDYFTLKTNGDIILYGFSPLRGDIVSKMNEKGYKVIAYLDRRADELCHISELSIYTIESAPFSKEYKNEVCVILCMQSALEHGRAAKKLYIDGYNNILFLPVDLSIEEKKANALRKQYNCFLRGQYDKIGNIPCYATLFLERFDMEKCIARRYDSCFIVWVPIEIIFVESDKNKDEDFNIGSFIYQELFSYLNQGNGDIESYLFYINAYVNTNLHIGDNGVDCSYLSHRMELYQLFQNELNRGMNFFINSAPLAKYSDGSKFHVLDGNHRAGYLYSKGFKFIPMCIDNEDWVKWLNYEKAKLCIEFLVQNKIAELPAPIAHPAFFLSEDKSKGCVYQLMRFLIKFISNLGIRGKTVFCYSQYHYFFPHLFYRMGAELVCHVETNQVIFEFTKLVNELLYINHFELYSNMVLAISSREKVDIAVFLGTVHFLMEDSNQKSSTNIKKLHINKGIIWGSGRFPDREKAWLIENTEFKTYHKLGGFFNGTYVEEFGFFGNEDFELSEDL